MNITFLGHSCVLLETEKHTIVIDPFITGNPAAKVSASELKVDAVLLTHGHGDHVGDTVDIAKRNDALDGRVAKPILCTLAAHIILNSVKLS
jgi:L-ascorbate metabolism protein UlaG (beta-lactamase superfamily)